MTQMIALALVIAPFAILGYAYVVYPALLWLCARVAPAAPVVTAAGAAGAAPPPGGWPRVSITVPAYNAGDALRPTLEHLVALDYPKDRLEIIVASDASTDHTDDIAREYADRGVRLFRMPERSGKTAVENALGAVVAGEIVVNVDALILVPRDSLKPLIGAFADPTVGVASGRDVSVAAGQTEGNGSESGYVGYEMWVRQLETRLGTIIGASGCFFGFRRFLHDEPLPPELSWDFATALVAREHGLRSVSVHEAICYVPRTAALRTELSRKARTMARGLNTLFYKGALMNPFRHGRFALMLVSHKLARWLPYLLVPVALLALGALAIAEPVVRPVFVAAIGGVLLGIVAIRWPHGTRPPRLLALAGYSVTVFSAGFLAWVSVLRGRRRAIWEPTPR